MSAAEDAETRARLEIEGSPGVFFVLCGDGNGTLYAVRLPSSDLGRFRLWDDADGFDVMFKLRGRWRRVNAAWRQLKGRNLDPAESRPVSVLTFGRRILKKMGVVEWKPGKRIGTLRTSVA